MSKVLRCVFAQSVKVLDGFVDWRGVDLVNSFCVVSLEKAYYDNLVEYLVALMQISEAVATNVS